MRRSMPWLFAILLAATTGGAVGAVYGNVEPPPLIESSGPAAATAVRDFYDAVDQVLMSGDTSALDAAVARDYVDHVAAPGLLPTRDGLARALLGLRSAFPTLRIDPEEVEATGDRVVARVRIEGAHDGRFLGLPLDGAVIPWGPIDVFRVAGGRVVEHWGTATGARFEELGTVPLGSLAGAPQILSMTRWTFPSGTHLEISAGEGTHHLVAENGDLTVAIVKSPGKPALVTQRTIGEPEPVPPGAAFDLASGTVLTLIGGTTYLLSNDADVEATAVAADIVPPGVGGPATTIRFDPVYSPPANATDAVGVTTFPGGVTMRQFDDSRMIFLPKAPATVALGRVVLAPAAQLPPNPVAGPVLLAVEAGRLDVDTGTGRVWASHGTSGASSEAAPSLDTGDGAFVPAGNELGLRNRAATLVTALVLTVMPAADPSDPV